MASLVSSEFEAFCQGQLRSLAQTTGASLGAVYIAENWLGGDSSGLLPVAIHPEHAAVGGEMALLAPGFQKFNESIAQPISGERYESRKVSGEPAGSLPLSQDLEPDVTGSSASDAMAPVSSSVGLGQFLSARLRRWQRAMERVAGEGLSAAELVEPSQPSQKLEGSQDEGESRGASLHQAMQPLLFDGRAVGMIVAAREHRDWQLDDYGHLEKIAQTLSTACAMERRLQWLQTRVHQQELAQEKQQDIIDNLLHQFRNPLTALRTFGKLLVRRLSPDDRNQAVAAGIVRESDRLQGLLSQIGETVDRFALPEAVMGELVGESEQQQPRLLPGRQHPAPMEQDKSKPVGEHAPLALPQGTLPSLPTALAQEDQVSPLTGKPLMLERYQIATLIDERLPSWEAIAQSRKQEVVVSLEAGLPPVWADAEALGEVLSNLVDNGLKYGSENGTVAISLCSSDELHLDQGEPFDVQPEHNALPAAWQCIAISDDGPGIPEADLPRLFERHFRGVQATGEKPGTGLGLAIAKALVEQMGGHIRVQSPAGAFHPRGAELEDAFMPVPHPGSVFLIWLKVAETS